MVSQPATPRSKAVRIALFSHKGGVGKTTLTVNISSALAAKGKKVLLVDADPQCNLTFHRVEEMVADNLLDKSESEEGKTLWSAVKPLVDGTGDVKYIEPIELVANTFLLPGDIRLAVFENELNVFWNECFQRKPKGFRGTNALSYLVNQVSIQRGVEFIFYDPGPNIGALNRVILLDCDFFIIPAACDYFSLAAIKTLGHTLETWIEDWRLISNLAPDVLYMLPGKPKLLGYIPQRFRVWGGQPTSQYAVFFPLIEKQIQTDVVSRLQRIDPSLVPNSSSLKLGEVQDYSSKASISQVTGMPIVNPVFETIADRIIEGTST